MILSHKTSHGNIAIALIALICAVQIIIPLHQAHAGLPVSEVASIQHVATYGSWLNSILGVPLTTAIKIATVLNQIEQYAYNYVLKPALRIAMASLVQSLTDQTVGFITGDGGRGVGFMQNFEEGLLKEADARAGEFLNRVSGINLCTANLSKFVKFNLSLPGYNNLNPQLACTLTGIRQNGDNFYNDFEQGGWATFIEISANPQNNAFGATLIAQANFEAAKNARKDDVQKKADQGNGFKGVQLTKKSDRCEWIPALTEHGVTEPGHLDCWKVDVATTPGNVIADSLNQNLNKVGLDFLTNEDANIIDNAISTIMTAVVQRLIKESITLMHP